jgi:hypothetical protein
MATIINVTMDEFVALRTFELACFDMMNGLFNEGKWYHGACSILSAVPELFTEYKAVVRRDVPSIPWVSRNVERFEKVRS